MVSILPDLRLADACTMVPAPHRHHFIISHSITSSASLEVSGSYNAKNMIIIINVVLVNVKTLLVMFCIMSPSCLQFSTLALPHHACHKEGLEENTLKRQSWISNFEKWWKWKVQNKFRNYISIRLPLLCPPLGSNIHQSAVSEVSSTAAQEREVSPPPSAACNLNYRDNYRVSKKKVWSQKTWP